MSAGLNSLPHEIPFRAVSRIVPIDDITARGLFLPSSNDALQGVPLELMLVEAMAQVGGSVVFSEPGSRGFLFGVDNVEIATLPEVGDRIDLEVRLEAELAGLFRFQGTARRGELLVCSARFYLASESRAGESEPK